MYDSALVQKQRCFRDSTFSQIISKNLPFNMVHYPRKLKFSFHTHCADSVEVWHCALYTAEIWILCILLNKFCSVGIIFKNRQDEFIQMQELQFRILQSFWSCSKQIQCGQERTKRNKHYIQWLVFQDKTSQNLVSLEPWQSYIM